MDDPERRLTLLPRARKFLRNAVADVRSCPRLADKLAVATADAARVLTTTINGAGAALGRPTDLIPSSVFPLRDVTIVNEDGHFWCRRRTSDYAVVRPDYERSLRGLFTLERGVFVDVGAHIGKYGVMVGRQLSSRGRVIAIEPDPQNFSVLSRNIRANALANVTAVNVACGDLDGEAILHRDPHDPIKHSIRADVGPGVKVGVRRLDSLLGELGVSVVDLLKLDAEGMEVPVLRGAQETLRRSPDIRIIVEAENDEPLEFLRAHDFMLERTHHYFGVSGWYYLATRKRSELRALATA